ncbi:MAG: glycosyltransferase family 4 protein [Rhodopirellula sp. JB044]|uniref:glycosyltransferase family 4 protein n=1 Tax=Rhodopirellula sp. JB044 TaxID=3342844 RepID=UPI00370C8E62
MRILLSTPVPELVSFLDADSGVDVCWLASADQIETLRSEGLGGDACEYQVSRSKLDLRSVREMRRAIQQKQPDLVHAFYGRALSHAVLATTGMSKPPAIVSFRGITSKLHRLDPSDWLTYLHPKVVAHACESNAVRDAMVASGIPLKNCFVTYNRVPPVAGVESRHELRSQLGIPENAFVVGTVATMRPVKGIDILLRAIIECSQLSDLHVLLVGSIKDKRVERLVDDPIIRDRVHPIGYHADAPKFLNAMDVFVMPSRQEALCLALLEAISCGVCPLVSDAGGLPEVVRHEVDGLVFPKEDVESLAASIRRLHSDRASLDEFARSAKRRSADVFSAESWCERVEGMYRDVLARRDGGQ